MDTPRSGESILKKHMDIPRDQKPKKRKRIIQWSVAAITLIVITGVLRNLKPAAPSVDAATVWRDTVQHGTMIRQVRGPGTLVPEQMRWITALTAGRVERINILPGTEIEANTVIIRMSNPDVEVQLLQAQQQLSIAEGTLIQLRATLETQRLTQAGLVAQVRTQYRNALREHQTNQRLYDTNPELVAGTELARTRDLVAEFEERLDLEGERLAVQEASREEQILAQADQIDRLRAIVEFNQARVASLEVTAGVSGVLAELPLDEGQWVQSGGTLARVVQPGRLKAEIRIPQTQAQDIAVGQTAFIDTRNDTIIGIVVRIDPSVQQGTVTIDVALPAELPRSARPDLSVDGNVVIQRLDDVTYVGRPAYGQANQRVGMFRITEDGFAERVNVLLGASSVNEIEVREGLQPGDIVILSDMSQWDGFDRVKLKGG
ncbi:MAG: HlyD family efflux transporter periplasmic adaptor subunit [Gemmatimonadota bacterium]|nr:MAG: HlyD family efflux transporter periplasmic adaptor subunit [Gemmatimonadota bacterium]